MLKDGSHHYISQNIGAEQLAQIQIAERNPVALTGRGNTGENINGEKMSKKKRPKRSRLRRPASRPRSRSGGLSLTTPEGDSLNFTGVYYQHNTLTEIRDILAGTDVFVDFEVKLDGTLKLTWYETDSNRPVLFAPIGRRILAHLTLTPDILEVEAMSSTRLKRCCQRLEQLLGERISPATAAQQAAYKQRKAAKPAPTGASPTPPPEFIAQIEEQMLRQWIDEKIPALGGLTPRQAVKTPEGRRQVLELIEQSQQMQRRIKKAPGMFSPDYNKVKKMLNLE